jgi:hypothetical protein
MNVSGVSGTSYTESLSKSSETVWTATRLSQLKNYAHDKMSVAQIAQKFRCTAWEVQVEADKLGVKLPPSSS